MEEARQVEVNDASNVIALFDPSRTPVPREPLPTPEELADFRKYWPAMKQMLTEFQSLKARGGCPIMQEVLGL
jgi:hypothetical protein